MSRLDFEDYKRRISIQEVLQDAGYRLNRRDGLRWPSYCRVDGDGRRIRGDKFIVCAHGQSCFQPPENKQYNVITFIAEHPELFPEGRMGKDPYAVVNEVCHRLLNVPMEIREQKVMEPRKESKPFSMSDYTCVSWKDGYWQSQKKFFPYFEPRGITRQTQRAFSDYFYLSAPVNKEKGRQNLSFPMRIPGSALIVGLEQRGKPDANGGKGYKGMAKGTNATEGVWFASPKVDVITSSNLSKIKDVYWFESAYAAMAYYQQRTAPLREQINEMKVNAKTNPNLKEPLDELKQRIESYDTALYVSTGGNPSIRQLQGVLSYTKKADQHVCFDNDRAGHVFAVDLLLTRADKRFSTSVLPNGQLQVIDQTEAKGTKYTLNLEPFEFDRIAHVLGVGNPDMKDYIASIINPKNVRSGDPDLLPSNSLAASYYDKIYDISEKYNNGELLQGIPPEQHDEVLGRYKNVMKELRTRFEDVLKSDIAAYERGKGCIEIETPPNGYKDWNEVTMEKAASKQEQTSSLDLPSESSLAEGKRQYDEQDTISAIGIDGEVVTDEVNQDHEEDVKNGEENDETKRHFKR